MSANTYAVQPSFADLGQPLADATFCVVDLETTGASAGDSITEIGAVKVRGGEVVGEFQTLVNPHGHIPALIAVLTGITNSMVAAAPRLPEVLPSFLEFAAGSILVAHNARFDIGFLKRACEQHGYHWPAPQVFDTVALARSILLRDEVANCKLSTLASHFHAATTPNHRALADARATVDVLHGLLGRVGNNGVATVEDLHEFSRKVSPQRRAKRRWAEKAPNTPGVYFFISDVLDSDRAPWHGGDEPSQILYVGTSNNLRRRVGQYFTASEKRGRMEEMIRVATGVEVLPCSTALEAEVLELRLIAAHRPRYNRRSKSPHRYVWLKLTDEAFPRLSIVRNVSGDQASYFGPFSARSAAEEVLMAIYEAHPIRRCTPRLRAGIETSDCALAEMNRCLAPCHGDVSIESYRALVGEVKASMHADVRPVLWASREKLTRLVSQQRFEEAASLRERLTTYTRASTRFHRLSSIASCPEIVAAKFVDGGWDIHVIRYGRLAASAYAPPGEVPQQVARAAVTAAETVLAPPSPQSAALVEETARIAAWLETPGIRLIEMTGEWSWPLHGAIAEDQLAVHALAELRRPRASGPPLANGGRRARIAP